MMKKTSKKHLAILIVVVIFISAIVSKSIYQNRFQSVSIALPHSEKMMYKKVKLGEISENNAYSKKYKFMTIVTFDKEDNFSTYWFDVASDVSLAIANTNENNLEGYVAKVNKIGDIYDLIILFSSKKANVGDSVNVKFLKITREKDNLIPIYSAVTLDGKYFVFQVLEEKSFLSKKYILKKTEIFPEIIDDENIYLGDFQLANPFVEIPSDDLKDGTYVRLAD